MMSWLTSLNLVSVQHVRSNSCCGFLNQVGKKGLSCMIAECNYFCSCKQKFVIQPNLPVPNEGGIRWANLTSVWISEHLKHFGVLVLQNVEFSSMFSFQHRSEHFVRLLFPLVTRPVGQSGVNHQMILEQVVMEKITHSFTNSFLFDHKCIEKSSGGVLMKLMVCVDGDERRRGGGGGDDLGPRLHEGMLGSDGEGPRLSVLSRFTC